MDIRMTVLPEIEGVSGSPSWVSTGGASLGSETSRQWERQEGGDGRVPEAHPVLPPPAEPGVRAPARPGGLLRLLQECVVPLHFPQRHHFPVLGMQPFNCPPRKRSQEGTLGPGSRAGYRQGSGQCQVLVCTCPWSCTLAVR